MASNAGLSLAAGAAEAAPAGSRPAGYPFRGYGPLARVAPFAVVAVLAEASLALPPGPGSAWATAVSVVLLLAVPAAFLLPWARLPAWLSVLVPLAYAGSVLALILAAGTTSGVGIVILIPLVWTALFHRRWESAWVVAAVVAVEVITSLTPVAVSDAVIARRVILWTSLGTLISMAAHGLRDRIRHSLREQARLQDRLRELTVLEDRDRIAADLQDKVIQQIFAAGMTLQSAAALTAEPEVRRRVEASVDDLDQVLRTLRDTIFGLQQRLRGHGLRQEIIELCDELSPPPEVSFSGPVDGALHPGTRAQLIELLREALNLIGRHGAARIDIAAAPDAYVTVLEIGPAPDANEATKANEATRANEAEAAFASLGDSATRLRDSAARAGIRVDIDPIPGGTRCAWKVPLREPSRG
jgi:signal transduction histidine kinase